MKSSAKRTVQPITQTCMFCLEACPPVVYVSPVCGCPASYHLPCKQTWDKDQPHTCPICRNVLLYVVNSNNQLNTQFMGRHPDEQYVSLSGGVTPSAPPSVPVETVTVPVGNSGVSPDVQQRSLRNQRIFAMIFTVLLVLFIIIMLKVMTS